jgi:hypothetical protein
MKTKQIQKKGGGKPQNPVGVGEIRFVVNEQDWPW